MQVELEPAFILHTRPYRDTSLLINLFSRHYGRVNCIVRGVRKSKSTKRNLLNPFQQLLVSFQGNSDLKLMTQFELADPSLFLEGRCLLSGFYLNELILRLLPEWDSHENLYSHYFNCLNRLASKEDVEVVLRVFEFALLSDLGYEVSFQLEARSALPIDPNKTYALIVTEGFVEQDSASFQLQSMNTKAKENNFFSGKDILLIGESNFQAAETLITAKRVARQLLKPLLGDKPLQSRELFA